MLSYIKDLINKENPASAQLAGTFLTIVVLVFLLLVLVLSSLLSSRNLLPHIGMIGGYLLGLVGWNIHKDKG